jgi:hypothetical protein
MTSVRRRLAWFAVIVAAWTAFGMLTAAQAQMLAATRGGTPRPIGQLIFGPAMIGAWLWALYTPAVALLARRIRRLRERRGTAAGWTLFIAAHLAAGTAIVLVDVPVWAAVRPLIDGVVLSFERVLAGTMLMNVFGYVAVVTITEAIDYAARWRERERAAAALERTAESLRRRLDEARLRALQSQLQPHFLYNTLNLVAELVHHEPDTADEMLIHLGALLRRSYREGQALVPLSEEVAFVRAYGEILARRYRDRVALTIRVPDELAGCEVPAFLLQPLVENAFRHGVEHREERSEVDVLARREGESLVVQVADRAAGRERRRDAEALVTFGAEGIGLRNTRERLALLYGERGSLTLVRTARETIASVRLPARGGWATLAATPAATQPAHA